MTEKKNKVFYGWFIVFACMLLSAATTGILSYFTALFIQPVSEALNVTRAAFSSYSSFATITVIASMPFIGNIFKRFKMTLLLALGTVSGAAALLAYSYANNVYVFYVAAIFSGAAVSLCGSIPIAILITSWFNEKRGLATGLAFTGSGLVSTLFASPISKVIENHGWKNGYRVLFVMFIIVMLIAIIITRKETPQKMGLLPLGQSLYKTKDGEIAGFTRKQVFATKSYWIFLVSIFFVAIITSGAQQQLISYWVDSGNSSSFAASIYSLMLAIALVAKALTGNVYDRFGVNKATIALCTTGALAFISLSIFTNGYFLILPALLFGILLSIQIIAPTYLTNKFFGDKEYSQIYGIVTMVFYFGVSVGVPLSALSFDSFGSYKPAWIVFAILSVVILMLVLIANKVSKKEFKKVVGIERNE